MPKRRWISPTFIRWALFNRDNYTTRRFHFLARREIETYTIGGARENNRIHRNSGTAIFLKMTITLRIFQVKFSLDTVAIYRKMGTLARTRRMEPVLERQKGKFTFEHSCASTHKALFHIHRSKIKRYFESGAAFVEIAPASLDQEKCRA